MHVSSDAHDCQASLVMDRAVLSSEEFCLMSGPIFFHRNVPPHGVICGNDILTIIFGRISPQWYIMNPLEPVLSASHLLVYRLGAHVEISPGTTGPLLFVGRGSLQSIVTTCWGAQNLSALATMLQLSCLFAVCAMTFQLMSGCPLPTPGFCQSRRTGFLVELKDHDMDYSMSGRRLIEDEDSQPMVSNADLHLHFQQTSSLLWKMDEYGPFR